MTYNSWFCLWYATLSAPITAVLAYIHFYFNVFYPDTLPIGHMFCIVVMDIPFVWIGDFIIAYPVTYIVCYVGKSNNGDERKIKSAAITMSALFGLLNIPAEYWMYVGWDEGFESIMRMLVLRMYTGSVCGMWLGHAIYKENFYGKNRFQFQLRSLIIFIVSTGILIAILCSGPYVKVKGK